jgi:hypothetical protein
MAEKAARSLLGAARKQLGDAEAWSLASDCMREKPLEPASWLAASLNVRMGTRSRGAKTDKFAVAGADYTASRAAAEESMRRAGITATETDDLPL